MYLVSEKNMYENKWVETWKMFMFSLHLDSIEYLHLDSIEYDADTI